MVDSSIMVRTGRDRSEAPLLTMFCRGMKRESTAVRTRPRGARARWRLAACAAIVMGALMCAPLALRAGENENPNAASGELSNQAFALLNSLNAPNPDGSANSGGKALVGPVASFAGDAQTLNQALSAGDTPAARRATAALDADAASVDSVLKAHQGAIKAAQWDSLKHQLAAIEKSVPPEPRSAAVAGGIEPPAAAPPPVVPAAGAAAPSPTDAGASGAAATAASSSAGAGPSIKIESRHTVGDVTRIKGYFEGTALKSAGIYEGDQNVKPIRVDHVIGQQKVDFELALRDADVMTNVRVFDQAGRMASASVFGEESTALASSGHESGVVVDRGAGATAGSNTAEIPSAREPASGGLTGSLPDADEGLGEGGSSLGGGLGAGGLSSPVGNVQINIESINPVNALSHTYRIAGQIIGRGVHSAAIYVDGRPVKRIPVSRGAAVSNFHTTFMMNGASATIRAFGAGNQYVESSIEIPPAVASSPPIVIAPINPYAPFGMNPYEMNPYGGMYGSPYGSPYGYNISPFGISRYPISPYGGTPYGAVPFGVNPYAAPINPYNTTVPPMGPAGR